MSLRVSYKKQLAFFILLALIFLIVVEVLVNIWLHFFYTCAFESSKIFENVDYETKKNLCLDNIYVSQTYGSLERVNGTLPSKGLDQALVFINSEGFRNPEFTKNKPDNTLRIFTVGGSTTFGPGVLDNQTYSAYLQSYYDDSNLDINIEVINTGRGGFWSFDETNLIKERLLAFDPDLFIVYDGWNDIMKDLRDDPNASPILWKERWLEICELGNQIGFDTLITLQPMVSTGKKILTIQEYEYKMRLENKKFLQDYPLYVEQLEELERECSYTADLRGIFDNTQDPIFFDRGHVGPKGNQIIAKNLFHLSLPIIKEKVEYLASNNYSTGLNLEEIDAKIISNDADVFFDEFDNFLKEIIFPYKTPRIFSIIFQD